MTTLKCGIIGYGYMGEIRRQVIERSSRLELVAIAETDTARLSGLNEYTLHDRWDAIFDHELDVLFVCTPNRFSPEICVKGLDAGLHVFCEKPPGRTVADVERIREAEARAAAPKLMFGFNHRFHPGIMQAKALIDSGRLGNLIALRGIYGKSGGVAFRHSWRNDREMSGGGILLDQGIHMLDLFCHFAGDFEDVKCFVANTFWKFDLEDNAFVILQSAAGRHASLHSSATLWKHTFRLELTLEQGYATVEGLLSKTGSYGREKLIVGKRQFEDEAAAVGNPSEEITYFDRDESWDLEVAEFVDCIDGNRAVANGSSSDALRVMRIVERAYRDAGVPRLELA